MPQAGLKPTEVGVTSFQLNTKWTLYLQATMAGFTGAIYNHVFLKDMNLFNAH